MSRSSVRALRALILARVVLEAVAFACLATLADFYTGGTLAVALPIAALAIAGVSLLVVAGLREAMTERRAGIVVACALVVSLVLAVGLPARDLDATAMLGRLIVFALIAEAYVWRTLTIARGAMRWEDTRRAVAIAASAVTMPR